MVIFPANKASLVQELIDLRHGKPAPNQPIRIEVAHEDSGECLFVLLQVAVCSTNVSRIALVRFQLYLRTEIRSY